MELSPGGCGNREKTNTFKNRLDKYWENHPLRWEYTADHDYTIKNITYNIEHAINEPEPEEEFKEELIFEAWACDQKISWGILRFCIDVSS